jgi:hypothetical protein
MSKNIERNVENPSIKEPYEPPEVIRIRLFAEEMASGACKSIMVGTLVCQRGGILFNVTQGS